MAAAVSRVSDSCHNGCRSSARKQGAKDDRIAQLIKVLKTIKNPLEIGNTLLLIRSLKYLLYFVKVNDMMVIFGRANRAIKKYCRSFKERRFAGEDGPDTKADRKSRDVGYCRRKGAKPLNISYVIRKQSDPFGQVVSPPIRPSRNDNSMCRFFWALEVHAILNGSSSAISTSLSRNLRIAVLQNSVFPVPGPPQTRGMGIAVP